MPAPIGSSGAAGPAAIHDPPIEVLWLIKGLGPGGAEHLLVSTARAADRGRFRFTVAYLLDWKDALVAPLEAEEVAVRCLGVTDARDLRWALRLRRFLRQHPFDIVHVHSPLVAAVARIVLLTLRDRPVMVSSEHNSWASHSTATRWLNRVTYRLDTAHIAVSSQVLSSLPAHLRDRTEVLVHGVDVAAVQAQRGDRAAARDELGIGPDQFAVCTIANLRWQKGYPDLMAAARQVIDEGHDVVFLAVGQGPLEAELRRRHAELGLGERFRLLGHRSDATRILAASDLFALASVHEGYPLAVMEALAAGVPVVATDAGGVPEAVRVGVEGLVVPSEQPAQLAAAISRLLVDGDLRGRMAAAATVRGRAFDIAGPVARTEEIYRSAIARQ